MVRGSAETTLERSDESSGLYAAVTAEADADGPVGSELRAVFTADGSMPDGPVGSSEERLAPDRTGAEPLRSSEPEGPDIPDERLSDGTPGTEALGNPVKDSTLGALTALGTDTDALSSVGARDEAPEAAGGSEGRPEGDPVLGNSEARSLSPDEIAPAREESLLGKLLSCDAREAAREDARAGSVMPAVADGTMPEAGPVADRYEARSLRPEERAPARDESPLGRLLNWEAREAASEDARTGSVIAAVAEGAPEARLVPGYKDARSLRPEESAAARDESLLGKLLN